MSLMRKQKLCTSFSEVRADLAQLPSLSISPRSTASTIYKNSVPPTTGLKTRPGLCLAQSSETCASPDFHLSVSPFSALGWPAGCRVPGREGRGPGSTAACTEAALSGQDCRSLIPGVPGLTCTHPLFAAHLQRQSRTSITGGETEARVGCGLAQPPSRAAKRTETS